MACTPLSRAATLAAFLIGTTTYLAAASAAGPAAPAKSSAPVSVNPPALPARATQAPGIDGNDSFARFSQLDTNRDAALSRQEAGTYPELLRAWSQLDTNGDDRLDRNEFMALPVDAP